MFGNTHTLGLNHKSSGQHDSLSLSVVMCGIIYNGRQHTPFEVPSRIGRGHTQEKGQQTV